jgi:hypothetical protein
MARVPSKRKARVVSPKAVRRARPRLTEEEEDRFLARAARKVLADKRTRWIPWSKVKEQAGLK